MTCLHDDIPETIKNKSVMENKGESRNEKQLLQVKRMCELPFVRSPTENNHISTQPHSACLETITIYKNILSHW